jgi:RNA-directed DNA polymerase
MTTMAMPLIGASPSKVKWDSINWDTIKTEVYRLQVRIAKAIREGCHGKVKALQWLLTHSFHAKLLAVKRVTQNSGSKTPGIDNVTWTTPQQKLKAAQSLKRRGYQPQPLKRIYIPKKDGQKRPLSIPTMLCRAMQALYLLALEPVAEHLSDKNSYGFRPKRSCADAMEMCCLLLSKKYSSQFILEGDIKSCFDRISHQWLRDNITMDREILNKWLTAGFMEKGQLYSTSEGISQGSIASPTILNLTLSGLEDTVIRATSKRKDKVHVVTYADDFIITASSKEVLENKVKPIVESFLRERGLELSKDKTKITHIDEGFDFLGITVRKYNGKYISTPSKKSIKHFLNNIRELIKSHPTAKSENLIHLLNQKIRGWTYYFRNCCAKKTFEYIDHQIFIALWQWVHRRHPRKGAKWRRRKYFRSHNLRNWIFTAKISKGNSKAIYLDLFEAGSVPIKRHIKIRSDANPFDPQFKEYFGQRANIVKGSQRVSTQQTYPGMRQV